MRDVRVACEHEPDPGLTHPNATECFDERPVVLLGTESRDHSEDPRAWRDAGVRPEA